MGKNIPQTNLSQTLEKLGIGENESTLYCLMLKHPETSVQKLQQLSPFPRTLLYYILNNLIRQGLVNAVRQKNRTIYLAENPEKLYDILSDREREFEQNKKAIQEIIPELKTQFRLNQQRPGVRIFEGLEGYRAFWQDVLESQPKCIYSYLPMQNKKMPGVEVRQEMAEKIKQQNIEEKFLTPRTKGVSKLENKNSQTRALPDGMEITADLKLYSGKIAITSFQDRELTITVIQDQNVFELQRDIFNHLWNRSVN
jgi:sugar-specific transcriptional regulator TrmB